MIYTLDDLREGRVILENNDNERSTRLLEKAFPDAINAGTRTSRFYYKADNYSWNCFFSENTLAFEGLSLVPRQKSTDFQFNDIPVEIMTKMLEYQLKQSHIMDKSVFDENIKAGKNNKGFNWGETKEGFDFWEDVITDKQYHVFFEKYPKINKPINIIQDEKSSSSEVIDIRRTSSKVGEGEIPGGDIISGRKRTVKVGS